MQHRNSINFLKSLDWNKAEPYLDISFCSEEKQKEKIGKFFTLREFKSFLDSGLTTKHIAENGYRGDLLRFFFINFKK